MIRLYRDKNFVTIHLSTDLKTEGGADTSFIFRYICSDTQYADLLHRYLRDRLDTAAYKLQREAYEQGWRDARAKKAKRDWFSRL